MCKDTPQKTDDQADIVAPDNEELKEIDSEEIGQFEHQLAMLLSATRSGPIPSAQELKEYRDVIPGLDRELIDVWKEETRFRRSNEERVQARKDNNEKNQIKSKWFTLSVTALYLLIAEFAALWLLYKEEYTAGVTILISPMAAKLVANLRRSASKTQDETEQDRE